jgi:hypothetical protein
MIGGGSSVDRNAPGGRRPDHTAAPADWAGVAQTQTDRTFDQHTTPLVALHSVYYDVDFHLNRPKTIVIAAARRDRPMRLEAGA